MIKVVPDQRCWYCGTRYMQAEFEIEHQTPLSRGGSDNDANKVLACRTCNVTKRERTVDEAIQ
jgi:5-methylcytosine-specific restriction endonuclease McrA